MISSARAYQLRALIERAAKSLDDGDALDGIELFPKWEKDTDYAKGIRVQYDRTLYRCDQTHTSQVGWEPPMVPALWTEVPRPGEIPVWKQPTGAQDAYMTGDKVHYPTKDDPVYESVIDGNIWSPDAYPAGWEVVA